jgi:tetratricopeptide (TPR) repeat protein
MQFPQQQAVAIRPTRRNQPCACGSGRRFKHCCAGKQQADPAETGLSHLLAGRAFDAALDFDRAIQRAPSVGSHHFHFGFALQQLGRDAEAMGAYRRAIALAPDHAGAHEHLGLMLQARGDHDEAMTCYRRVHEIEATSPMGHLNHARLLHLSGRSDEAEAALRQAMMLYPTEMALKRYLATMLRERGCFDEAIELLLQATAGDPLQAASAYCSIAMSKRITEADRTMVARLQALLDGRKLMENACIRVNFALGKAFDDLADHEAAMRHYDAANRLVRGGNRFDRARVAATAQSIIRSTDRRFFDSAGHARSGSELPVLILGMPRSGTTLVEQIVSSHPEAGGAGELQFWNRTAFGSASTPAANLQGLAAKYEAVLHEAAPSARRVTDKMPGNFFWIGLFHLVFPKGRVIHCRRHPVDTCLSAYFTNFNPPIPFAAAKGDLLFYYRCYERLMQHWRDVLDPGVMLEVEYETLVADSERVTRGIIDFIGLAWNDACLRPQDNNRRLRTASKWQARQPVYRSSVARWRHYEPWLGELRELLPDHA